MKLGLCASVVLIGFFTASAHAAGRLATELRPAQTQFNRAYGLGDGHIDLVLKNDGDQMIEVSKDDIPMTNSQGRLIANSFIVTGEDGNEVPYTGIVVDYDESQLRTVRIPPKHNIVTPISIAKNYQVAIEQSYTVSLRQPIRYIDRPRELMVNRSKANLLALMKTAETIGIRIVIDARTDMNSLRSFRTAAPPQQCTSEQLSLFQCGKSHCHHSVS